MRTFLAIALCLVGLVGCDTPGGSMQILPYGDPQQPWTAQPTESKHLIIVVTSNCPWCDKQKEVLQSMKDAGELRGIDVTFTWDNGKYPARAFPTTYFCRGGKCYPPYTGFRSREEILRMVGD